MLSRRTTLAFATALIPSTILAACSGTPAQQQVTFDKAKSYFDTGAMAVMAAAQTYLASSPPPAAASATIVRDASARLQQIKTTLDGATLSANWKASVLEGLSLIQQLQPTLAIVEGPAAQYIPLVIAIVTAFVQQLPDPAPQQPAPPAALRAMALRYHHGE